MHGHFHPLQGAVCYDHGHLFAPVCHAPVSWDSRRLEKPSSPPPLLVGLHASPLSRAEDLEELARWTPAQVMVWRLRLLLKASYWNVHLLVWNRWAQEALNTSCLHPEGGRHLSRGRWQSQGGNTP